MKKVISLLICILLLVSISIPAFAATDIDAIKPSGTTIVVGITGKDVPVHGTLPNANAGTAIIIYEVSVRLLNSAGTVIRFLRNGIPAAKGSMTEKSSP